MQAPRSHGAASASSGPAQSTAARVSIAAARVEGLLRRVPEWAASIVQKRGRDGSLPRELTDSELEALVAALGQAYQEIFDTGPAAAQCALADARVRVGILQLAAFGYRGPAPPLVGEPAQALLLQAEWGAWACDLANLLVNQDVTGHPAAVEGQRWMAHGLLQTGAIPAAARQLANLADALRNSAVTPSRAFCEAAFDHFLEPALDLPAVLLSLSMRSGVASTMALSTTVLKAVDGSAGARSPVAAQTSPLVPGRTRAGRRLINGGVQGSTAGRLTFPAEPPLAVAASLAGGALPLLERLLRRAGEAPGGLESGVLGGSGNTFTIGMVARVPLTASLGLKWTWGCLLPLLAYGDPLQAAALVASAAKLLRRTDVNGRGGRVGPALVCELVQPLTAPGHLDGAAPAVRARLGLVLSVGLGEWVAELWRVVGVADAGTGPAGATKDEDTRDACLATLLGLCRTSVAVNSSGGDRGGGGGGSSTGGSGRPVGGGGDSRSSGGGGGAPWLPTGLAAVEVEAVGLALWLLQAWTPAAGPEPFGLIAETGLATAHLAASRPQEVRALGASGSANAWQPAAVRAVAEAVRRGFGVWQPAGGALRADTVAALGRQLRAVARQLEAWRAGEEGEGGGVDPDPEVWADLQAVVHGSTLGAALARQLVPPAEARRRLGLPPACSHPACANLAGDSEAGLRLRQCGRCGQAGYCCRECQTAHWRGGHRQACGGGSGSGGSKAS
ncbi:hypothetical protein HYH03_003954 [Edaphochlamys debaryana]|uniref:phytol kinase n=1 Tax=Edaphochlamys debaryana TaxID=47281 RepID=A0A835YCB1_9CHLO|nr:hypothetical protein HYH03_003954 [Edaphochlamys debaryana]|eukprot:KAG2498201.1 hypothetical protein HYH03_003954 [Edaphochlamys debaryana]